MFKKYITGNKPVNLSTDTQTIPMNDLKFPVEYMVLGMQSNIDPQNRDFKLKDWHKYTHTVRSHHAAPDFAELHTYTWGFRAGDLGTVVGAD
jgi:hypothetical protein